MTLRKHKIPCHLAIQHWNVNYSTKYFYDSMALHIVAVDCFKPWGDTEHFDYVNMKMNIWPYDMDVTNNDLGYNGFGLTKNFEKALLSQNPSGLYFLGWPLSLWCRLWKSQYWSPIKLIGKNDEECKSYTIIFILL